ncbi:hypothetical protein CF319_g8197, partial [Tilletia indica]
VIYRTNVLGHGAWRRLEWRTLPLTTRVLLTISHSTEERGSPRAVNKSAMNYTLYVQMFIPMQPDLSLILRPYYLPYPQQTTYPQDAIAESEERVTGCGGVEAEG